MAQADTSQRLQAVEQRMERWEARFDAAAASVGEPISHHRDETQVESSAIRQPTPDGDERVRTDLTATLGEVDERLQQAIRDADERIRTELTATIGEVDERLQQAIRNGDEETRRFMRVLHEEVIDRIARIGEAR